MKPDAMSKYAQIGIRALLPGMRYMLELMERAFQEQQDLLALMQQVEPAMASQATQVFLDLSRGRQKAVAPPEKAPKTKSGWSDDPEERKAEMKRRMKKRKMHKAAVARWENKTKAQKAEQLRKMAQGKVRAEKTRKEMPAVKLESVA